MDPITIGLIAGAGLGLGKYVDGSMRAKKERERQAAITRYSPWTGMQGQSVASPSIFGDLATGAAAGSTLGQGFKAANPASPTDTNAVSEAAAAPGGAADASKYSVMGNPGAMNASKYGLGVTQGSAGALGANPWLQMQQDPNLFQNQMSMFAPKY